MQPTPHTRDLDGKMFPERDLSLEKIQNVFLNFALGLHAENHKKKLRIT